MDICARRKILPSSGGALVAVTRLLWLGCKAEWRRISGRNIAKTSVNVSLVIVNGYHSFCCIQIVKASWVIKHEWGSTLCAASFDSWACTVWIPLFSSLFEERWGTSPQRTISFHRGLASSKSQRGAHRDVVWLYWLRGRASEPEYHQSVHKRYYQ